RLFEPSPFRQKHRQRSPGVSIRAHDAVRHLQTAEELLMRGHERVESLQIFCPRSRRRDDAARAALQVLENSRFVERKLDLIAIQHLKNDDFVAVKAKLFEAEFNLLGGFEQIGKKENNTPAMDQPNRVLNQLRQS